MESDSQSLEDSNSHQVIWVSEEGQRSSHAKSYKCTFCKRGFSSAQALGGHMNIHRKDRAKLKLPPSDHEDDEKSSSTDEIKVEPVKLTLFAETPSGSGNRISGSHEDGNKEKSKEMITSSTMEEVDLELRLGPEPLDTKTVSPKELQ